jgi:hypothetical protein
VLVLSAGNLAAPPEFLEAWTNAQSDLARLSTRGSQISIANASDLLHDAPDAIVVYGELPNWPECGGF